MIQFGDIQFDIFFNDILMCESEVPESSHEAERTVGSRIAPGCALVGRSCKHHERAGSVGTELADDGRRFHNVVLRLGHLFDAARFDGQTVFLCSDLLDSALGVINDIEFARVEPTFSSVGEFAVETFSREHALSEEALEGFVKFDEAQVAHDFGPEAGVEQVKHGVFDTADILVHSHPVVIAFVDHGSFTVGRAIAHVIPTGIDEGVHRVGFAFSVSAALRTLAVKEGFVLIQGVARAVRD